MKKIVIVIALFITVLVITGCVSEEVTIAFSTTGDTHLESITIKQGESITLPDEPIYEGYDFQGWFVDSVLEIPFNENNPITEDLILYGKWALIDYNLIFQDYDGTVLESYSFNIGADITDIIPAIPTRENYDFMGWDKESPNIMPAEDVTIMAMYQYHSVHTLNDMNPIMYWGFINSFIKVDTSYNNDQGAIFFFDITNLSSERLITGSDSVPGDLFGSLHMSAGDYLIVAATMHNENGAYYLYKISDPSFERKIEEQQYVIEQQSFFDIKIIDDYIIIPSTGYNNDTGCVNIYKLSDPSYHRVITASDGEEGALFGDMFTVDDDYIIIQNQELDSNRKSIYLYKFSDETFERKYTGNSENLDWNFGHRYELHGDYLIVSEVHFGIPIAAIYIFKTSDPTYIRKIIKSDYHNEDVDLHNFIIQDGYIILPFQDYPYVPSTSYIFRYDDDDYIREITASRVTVEGDFLIRADQNQDTGEKSFTISKLSDPSYNRVIYSDYLTSINNDLFFAEKGDCYYNRGLEILSKSNEEYSRMILPSGLNSARCYYFDTRVEGDNIILKAQDKYTSEYQIYLYKISDPSYEYQVTLPGFEEGIFPNNLNYGLTSGNLWFFCDNCIESTTQYNYIINPNDPTTVRTISPEDIDPEHSYRLYTIGDYIVIEYYVIVDDEIESLHARIYSISDESYVRDATFTNFEDSEYVTYLVVSEDTLSLIFCTRGYWGPGIMQEVHVFKTNE